MNYLQLTQRLALEAGAGTVSTTVNQTGEVNRLCQWINSAWMDIQEAHTDWQWMRKSVSFTTVTGQAIYSLLETGATDLSAWNLDTFRIYPTATGFNAETFLMRTDYESWRNVYQFGPQRTAVTRPIYVTAAPDKSLCLGPNPDDTGYTVIGDYYKVASELSGDTTSPDIPTQYHMAIVWRALMLYGSFEAAAESYQRGEQEFAKIIRRLELDRLPQASIGGAMV